MAANNLEVFIGTYEQYLLSYKVAKEEDEKFSLKRFIAEHTHTSSIKCLDYNGRYLAVGGLDDRIVIFDLQKNHEIQSLLHHHGTISQLQFSPDGSHLFSSSEDGSFAATKTGSWVLDFYCKTPHSGKPVTYFAIHPSGKLALSLGKDETLRTWNILKGRQTYTTNVNSFDKHIKGIDHIAWSPDGLYFSMKGNRKVIVVSIKSGDVASVIASSSQATSLCWLDNRTILLGHENGNISFNFIDEKDVIVIEAYEKERVKTLSYLNGVLASSTSPGKVTIWNVSLTQGNYDLSRICQAEIGCRPVCMTLFDPSSCGRVETIKLEETPELAAEIENAKKVLNMKRQIASVGTVTIEVDEATAENDEPTAPKKRKASKPKSDRTPKKNKAASPVSDKKTNNFVVQNIEPATAEVKLPKEKKNKKAKVNDTPIEIPTKKTRKTKSDDIESPVVVKRGRKAAIQSETGVLTPVKSNKAKKQIENTMSKSLIAKPKTNKSRSKSRQSL